MTDEPKPDKLTVEVSAETIERIAFLAGREGLSAQAGLARGPHLRKYMYR